MPHSSVEGKDKIKEWFDSRDDIKFIVDIGPGAGTYPKLLGDKYDWTCIEIFEPYVARFELDKLYGNVIVGDFFDKIEGVEGDCIIFGDVLEHMTKKNVIKALEIADRKFKHIVISIPVNYEQGPSEGNPHEEHKSVWTMEEINAVIPPSFVSRGISWNIAIFIK